MNKDATETSADTTGGVLADINRLYKITRDQGSEIECLRKALRDIRSSIEDTAPDVVWMSSGIQTVVDFVYTILKDDSDE